MLVFSSSWGCLLGGTPALTGTGSWFLRRGCTPPKFPASLGLHPAKHCLENFRGNSIELFHEEQWKTLEVKLVGFGSNDTDICVLSPKIQLSPTHPLPPTIADMTIGQDAYFLGFPYGIQIEAGNLNRLFPFPLVKRATVSGISFEEQKIILLDGHNNPGFSGGPVVS